MAANPRDPRSFKVYEQKTNADGFQSVCTYCIGNRRQWEENTAPAVARHLENPNVHHGSADYRGPKVLPPTAHVRLAVQTNEGGQNHVTEWWLCDEHYDVFHKRYLTSLMS